MSKSAVLPTSEVTVVETEIGGRVMRFETGELAKQAGGAVLVTYGETVVLVTATANAKPKAGVSFFPLTVDYEEKMYAAGKIPGGWIKREGRAPERATLTSRLIDRPIRPQFPDGFRNDTHVVGMCLSVDGENEPDVLAVCGAGAALSISDIPFDGPVAAVRIGYIDGEFKINPTQTDLETSQLNLVVAGTRTSICMVEAGAYEVSEDLLLEAFEEAHESIRKIIDCIDGLVKQAGKPKKDYPIFKPNSELDEVARKHFAKEVAKGMRIVDKAARGDAFAAISREALSAKISSDKKLANKEALLAILADPLADDFDSIIKKMEEEELVDMIVNENKRPDGRKTTEIRKLSAKTNILPRTHGTGLFTRGQTQILSICTLGTLAEEQSFDNIIGEVSRRYIHQYNFPPFSVGEARFMRGPGRREIGHGALAERALVPVIPSEDEFPYTFRIVSEALESNGSTSMASVCGSTLSLMDAGVPIKAPVGGIAMGLVMAKDGKYAVLTDIQGLEDHLGEMDFKVAGTRVGVTALQMDIKLKGITMEILRQALHQANTARMEILNVIEGALAAPRPEISKLAPLITCFSVNPERIKDIIGPGGKTINKIVAETGVKIDIENDGRVFVAAVDRNNVEKARKMIEDLTRDVEAGTTYVGTVMRVTNFGAFVEILPGKEGLLHSSQLKPYFVARPEDVVKVGDSITVVVEEVDHLGRLNLSRRGHFTPEELAQAEAMGGSRPQGGGGGRGERPERGDRGDRGDRGPRRDEGRGRNGSRHHDAPEVEAEAVIEADVEDVAVEEPEVRGERTRIERPSRRHEAREEKVVPARDEEVRERPRHEGRGPRRDDGYEPRPRGDRPERSEAPARDRGPAPSRDRFESRDRGRDDRPAAREDRPREDRFRDDRPARDRDDRPARDDRPRDDRPRDRDDRPARDDRPVSRDRDDRFRNDRPRDDRPRDDRPARERDDRPAPRDRDRAPAPRRDFDEPRGTVERDFRDRGMERIERGDRGDRTPRRGAAPSNDRGGNDRGPSRDRNDRFAGNDRNDRGPSRDRAPEPDRGRVAERPAPRRDLDLTRRDVDGPSRVSRDRAPRPELPPSLRQSSAAPDRDADRRPARRRPRDD